MVKVRCNNCMTIYDEDIDTCKICKTDKYLMENFSPNKQDKEYKYDDKIKMSE
jgi:hypothetical protein